jgi:hypothetical protein
MGKMKNEMLEQIPKRELKKYMESCKLKPFLLSNAALCPKLVHVDKTSMRISCELLIRTYLHPYSRNLTCIF